MNIPIVCVAKLDLHRLKKKKKSFKCHSLSSTFSTTFKVMLGLPRSGSFHPAMTHHLLQSLCVCVSMCMFISGRKQTSLLPGNEGVELAEEVRVKKICSCPLCTGSCTVTCCIFQPLTSVPGTCWCVVSILCIAFESFFFLKQKLFWSCVPCMSLKLSLY